MERHPSSFAARRQSGAQLPCTPATTSARGTRQQPSSNRHKATMPLHLHGLPFTTTLPTSNNTSNALHDPRNRPPMPPQAHALDYLSRRGSWQDALGTAEQARPLRHRRCHSRQAQQHPHQLFSQLHTRPFVVSDPTAACAHLLPTQEECARRHIQHAVRQHCRERDCLCSQPGGGPSGRRGLARRLYLNQTAGCHDALFG